MCHNINVQDMVGSKKTLRTILDIRSNDGGHLCTFFPSNYHLSKV